MESRILVVGGGIAGLSTAIAARHGGLDVDVVEQRDEVGVGAAGIGLHVVAQRMLDRLGVADRVREVAFDLDVYHFVREDGRDLGRHEYTAVFGTPTWSVHRADLNAILADAIPSASLRLGVTVAGVTPQDEHVEVRFSSGGVEAYGLVIGADGVHSGLRLAVIGTSGIRYGGACFWRTTLPSRLVDDATGFVLRSGSLGLVPLTGDRTHAFFQVRTDEVVVDEVDGRVDRLRRRFQSERPEVQTALDLLPADESVHFGALEWVEPPSWGFGRIVLIGDAAHAMAPPLALGAAMAMEDAVVLIDELGRAGQLEEAIRRFSERRDPRVRFVQERTAITWDRNRGIVLPGEPTDPIEFDQRNFGPLLTPP